MSQIEIINDKSLTNTIVSSEMDVSETNEMHQQLPLNSSMKRNFLNAKDELLKNYAKTETNLLQSTQFTSEYDLN